VVLTLFHEKLSEHTGIDGVARTSNLPGRTFSRTGVIPEGTSEDDIYIWRTFSISPAFIPTMDMKIAEGRNFDIEIDSDNDGVVLINQTAARQLGWETPIGKRIFLEGNDSLDSEVIGVVKDFHADGLQQPIEPIIIFKLPEGTGRTLVARIKKGNSPTQWILLKTLGKSSTLTTHSITIFCMNYSTTSTGKTSGQAKWSISSLLLQYLLPASDSSDLQASPHPSALKKSVSGGLWARAH